MKSYENEAKLSDAAVKVPVVPALSTEVSRDRGY